MSSRLWVDHTAHRLDRLREWRDRGQMGAWGVLKTPVDEATACTREHYMHGELSV